MTEADRCTVHEATIDTISNRILYQILRLRSEVFVVEQDCVFLDLDGLDLLSTTRQLWVGLGDVEGQDGTEREEIASCVRILEDEAHTVIGRVATHRAARSQGVASSVLRHAINRCEQLQPGNPILIEAQSHLEGWYAGFGFARSGPNSIEDGIEHLPMIRLTDASAC